MNKKEFEKKKNARIAELEKQIEAIVSAESETIQTLKNEGKYKDLHHNPKYCAPKLRSEIYKLKNFEFVEGLTSQLPSDLDNSRLVNHIPRVLKRHDQIVDEVESFDAIPITGHASETHASPHPTFDSSRIYRATDSVWIGTFSKQLAKHGKAERKIIREMRRKIKQDRINLNKNYKEMLNKYKVPFNWNFVYEDSKDALFVLKERTKRKVSFWCKKQKRRIEYMYIKFGK